MAKRKGKKGPLVYMSLESGFYMAEKAIQKVTPEFIALVRTIIKENLASLKELAKH